MATDDAVKPSRENEGNASALILYRRFTPVFQLLIFSFLLNFCVC